MIGPYIRLAHCGPPEALLSGLRKPYAGSPQVRLAHTTQGVSALTGQYGRIVSKRIPESMAPALLVSFVYLAAFEKAKARYCYRNWALDSGAFSAHQSGNTIDLLEYIETCKRLMAKDATLEEVFALDVIGDWKASLKNCERMWEAGVPAIPCYHIGEPDDALRHIAKTYPKIALGGVAMRRGDAKMAFANRCSGMVWPKKIHGFGFGREQDIMALPWHSVDATNWEIGPCGFGRWVKYGQLQVRGSRQNLRSQIQHYLDMETKARIKWAKQMAELDSGNGIEVRLIAQGYTARREAALAPTVRLAEVKTARTKQKEEAFKQ